jgi:hypothetical protein
MERGLSTTLTTEREVAPAVITHRKGLTQPRLTFELEASDRQAEVRARAGVNILAGSGVKTVPLADMKANYRSSAASIL